MKQNATDIQELIKAFNQSAETFKEQQTKILKHEETLGEVLKKVVSLTDKVNNYSQNNQVTVLRGKRNPVVWSDVATAKRFVDMFKAMFSGAPGDVRTLVEGTDADGGYTVHPEFTTTIMRLISLYGFIRQFATIVPMSSDELHQSTLASGITTYWVDENNDITTSSPQFGRVTLTPKKLCALIPASNEFTADTTIALANFLASLVAEAFAREEDKVGLVGSVSGGDPFNGVINATGVNVVFMAAGETAFSDFHTDHALDMQSEVIDAARSDGSRYVMEFSVESVLRQIKETTGGYIYGNPQDGATGVLWGRPVNTSELMPSVADVAADSTQGLKGFVIYGDFKHFLLGDRETMSIMRSDHVYFVKDTTAWRFKRRVAMNLGIPSAFVVLKTYR